MSTERLAAEAVVAQASHESITGICSMATRYVLSELATAYERRSSQRVAIESVAGVDAARRVGAGEAFDFVVLAAASIDKLVAADRVDPDTRIDLARSSVAVAVPAGAAHPDLRSEQAVRDAVLAAHSVGYSTGPSGQYLARLFERWGLADTLAPRMVEAPPGVAVGTLLARGDVEIGFQQLSELMHLSGIDVVGTLPSEIQEITVFSGAVCVSSPRRAAAKAFLASCASPEAAATKRVHGMEP
jgi:molybdate transport system substrate-binding protein